MLQDRSQGLRDQIGRCALWQKTGFQVPRKQPHKFGTGNTTSHGWLDTLTRSARRYRDIWRAGSQPWGARGAEQRGQQKQMAGQQRDKMKT